MESEIVYKKGKGLQPIVAIHMSYEDRQMTSIFDDEGRELFALEKTLLKDGRVLERTIYPNGNVSGELIVE